MEAASLHRCYPELQGKRVSEVADTQQPEPVFPGNGTRG